MGRQALLRNTESEYLAVFMMYLNSSRLFLSYAARLRGGLDRPFTFFSAAARGRLSLPLPIAFAGGRALLTAAAAGYFTSTFMRIQGWMQH
jgi:hypothetical protein